MLVSSHVLSEVQHTVDDVVIIAPAGWCTPPRWPTWPSSPRRDLRRVAGRRRAREAGRATEAGRARPEGAGLVLVDVPAAEVGAAAFAAGLELHQLASRGVELEDVFLGLTGGGAREGRPGRGVPQAGQRPGCGGSCCSRMAATSRSSARVMAFSFVVAPSTRAPAAPLEGARRRRPRLLADQRRRLRLPAGRRQPGDHHRVPAPDDHPVAARRAAPHRAARRQAARDRAARPALRRGRDRRARGGRARRCWPGWATAPTSTTGEVVEVLVLGVVVTALWAVIGVAFGSVVPNQVAAIVVILAFTQFVEPIARLALGAFDRLDSVAKFLPGAAADGLMGASLFGEMGGGSGDLLSRGAALVVLLGYAGGLALVGRLHHAAPRHRLIRPVLPGQRVDLSHDPAARRHRPRVVAVLAVLGRHGGRRLVVRRPRRGRAAGCGRERADRADPATGASVRGARRPLEGRGPVDADLLRRRARPAGRGRARARGLPGRLLRGQPKARTARSPASPSRPFDASWMATRRRSPATVRPGGRSCSADGTAAQPCLAPRCCRRRRRWPVHARRPSRSRWCEPATSGWSWRPRGDLGGSSAAARPIVEASSRSSVGRHSFLSRTYRTEWSRSLRSTRVARDRVGRMFCDRLGPLMVSQIRCASATASSSGERAVLGEVGVRVPERRLAQPQEALDVPVADVAGAGVDVHAEVEEVAQGQAGAAVVADPRGLEHVEALDDHDVRPLDDDLLVRDHVVGEVGVDRRLDLVLAGLDVDDEAQQGAAVVGLREALALQQPAALELGVRVEEAVGGHQRDVGVLGPVREHLLEHAGGRRLADRHRAGQPDHERRALRLRPGGGTPPAGGTAAPADSTYRLSSRESGR